MNILVRDLPKEFTEKDLFELFMPFGKIKALNIVTDPATGSSKGFGFVEMKDDTESRVAMKELNGKVILGERIRVKGTKLKSIPSLNSLRKERPERPKRFESRDAKSTPRGKPSAPGKPSTPRKTSAPRGAKAQRPKGEGSWGKGKA